MRHLLLIWASHLLTFLALYTMPGVLLAQGTGSLTGSVVDDSGKALAATVRVSRAGSPPFTASVRSSAAGSFTFTSIPAGNYTACVIASGYLDPCTWTVERPVTKVIASQTTQGVQIVAKKGAQVNIHLADDDHVLGHTPQSGKTVPHVLVGVLTTHMTFEPAALLSSDANGRDHQATIPVGEPVVLHITGSGVHLTDNNGASLNAAGYNLTLNQAAGSPPGLVTIHVRN
jgi:hypothetical protein